jgi:lipoyl(octanoyl) transferase
LASDSTGARGRQWVTYHGIAINVEPDLSHFDGIVPCGISEHGVTSLADLGLPVTMDDLDVVLKDVFDEVFGLEARPMTLQAKPAPDAPGQPNAGGQPDAPDAAGGPQQVKLPHEAMATDTGMTEADGTIEETHPVFRI